MRKELRDYLVSLGLRADASESDAWQFYNGLAGEQRDRARSLRSDRPAPSPPPPAPPAQDPPGGQRQDPPANPPPQNPPQQQTPDQIRAAERERIATIREHGAAAHVPAELVEQAVTEGWDVGRASTAFLTAMRDRPAPAGPGIHSRSHEGDCTLEALQGAMMLRAGLELDNPIFARAAQRQVAESLGLPVWLGRAQQGQQHGDEQSREIALRAMDNAHSYSWMSLFDVCREAIRLDGGQVPASRTLAIRTAVSGGSLTGIFTTTVGAQLLYSYVAAPDSTMGWCSESDVSNFQPKERHLLSKGNALQKLPRGKKAEHTTNSEGKETYQIARYAQQFAVDEQDLIDDAFNALRDMPRDMGEAARQLRPDLVYSILLANDALDADSVALFDASTHVNLRTSAGLSKDTLATAQGDMNTQQQNGRALNLFGKYLIVPQALVWDARQIVRSGKLVGQGKDAAAVGDYNPIVEDNLEIRADSRLDNGVTDPASGTVHAGAAGDWYLAAKGGRHTIEVGYLAGTGRAPQLRSFVLTEGQYGIGWDVCQDVGAKALDFRGLHKSEQ